MLRQTEDGVTGVFTDTTENKVTDGNSKTTIEPGWTIEQLYEYFADWDDFVKRLITEAGGSFE